MWQAAGDVVRATGRFARRHRRAIVVGGVVGAAACVYHSMKKALKEAEQEHEELLRRAGEEGRYRQCLGKTRGECMAALANFLSPLRKRLFLAVDVTGPVRELKALRGGSGGQGSRGGSGGGSSGGGRALADGSVVAAADELESREVELWEQVKVTALTRLVVSLYAFNALALMLHMQLHILGRLSFEESRELERRAAETEHASLFSPDNNATSALVDGVNAAAATASVGRASVAGVRSARDERGEVGLGVGRGVALSAEARHALLSSTYEHILGDGLRELVVDVERAVARCTSSWHAHTRQQVGFQDLVSVLRRVRREVEGPVGGTGYDGEPVVGSGGGGGDGRGFDDIGGRVSRTRRHSSVLRYIINPSDGIGGEAIGNTREAPPASDASASDGAEGAGFGGMGVAHGLQGADSILDETWDTAESPNFGAALQSCLDATFGMVYEQLRQKAFCRGGGRGRQRSSTNSTVEGVGDNEGSGGGRAAPTPEQQQQQQQATGAAWEGSREEAGGVGGGIGGAGGAGAAVMHAVGEREEFSQVLATVISQAKLVVSEILEPSPRNEYAQAVVALPAVQDLCVSVFGSTRAPAIPPPPPTPTAAPPAWNAQPQPTV